MQTCGAGIDKGNCYKQSEISTFGKMLDGKTEGDFERHLFEIKTFG
jgi:hypothetical protein